MIHRLFLSKFEVLISEITWTSSSQDTIKLCRDVRVPFRHISALVVLTDFRRRKELFSINYFVHMRIDLDPIRTKPLVPKVNNITVVLALGVK
ncbi:hypothetical protein CHS0354_000243 [Potamilus streckersoni]|uniref:Uncharacterized protein n=1 Tax=Potamilus streckersoni TaxID=2493646 RepID=A0AAE0VH91_9BIVA|nr:hypothetical protein CHS0354_000243 [Potamilus streckersoni]